MIINGLSPFIPVTLIGTTTYGKNVGSITVYDSPSSDYTDVNAASDAHLYAMQPIVFQIYNKLGQSDYTQGFAPDFEVKEYEYWNNILPFGDKNEILLKTALDQIAGTATAKMEPFKSSAMRTLKMPVQFEERFEKEMYIQPDELKAKY